ncbi:MAG: UBP-type zinc finger domain-containing protein [Candidatus Dormibacteria bacterium]
MPANEVCGHLETIKGVTPSGSGCVECITIGRHDWLHLRVCQVCGHVGCCDQSPGKHATAHYHAVGDPIIRSYEPGEEWYYCYPDDMLFELENAPPAPHHP